MPTEKNVHSIIYNLRKQRRTLKKHIEELQEKLDIYQERTVNNSIDNKNRIYWITEGDLLCITIIFIFIGLVKIVL